MTNDQMLRQYKAKIVKTNGFLAYAVNHNTKDIFMGDGWENQSRYRLIRGHPCHMSGVRLSAVILDQAFKK